MAGAVGGQVGRLVALNKAMPAGVPRALRAPVAFEAQGRTRDRTPGLGVVEGGAAAALGPVGGVRAVAGDAAIGAGLEAVEGGDAKSIATEALVPVALSGAGRAGRSVLNLPERVRNRASTPRPDGAFTLDDLKAETGTATAEPPASAPPQARSRAFTLEEALEPEARTVTEAETLPARPAPAAPAEPETPQGFTARGEAGEYTYTDDQGKKGSALRKAKREAQRINKIRQANGQPEVELIETPAAVGLAFIKDPLTTPPAEATQQAAPSATPAPVPEAPPQPAREPDISTEALQAMPLKELVRRAKALRIRPTSDRAELVRRLVEHQQPTAPPDGLTGTQRAALRKLGYTPERITRTPVEEARQIIRERRRASAEPVATDAPEDAVTRTVRLPQRFTKASIEKQLMDAARNLPQRSEGIEGKLVDSPLEGASPFRFRGPVPTEVRERFEGRADLRMRFKGNDPKGRGEDLLAELGDDQFFTLAEPMVQEASPTNQLHQAKAQLKDAGMVEPQGAFLAFLHDKLEESGSSRKPMEEIDPATLNIGDEFTIQGEPFQVVRDEFTGETLLEDGITLPAQAFDSLPVDEGSITRTAQVEPEVQPAAASREAGTGLGSAQTATAQAGSTPLHPQSTAPEELVRVMRQSGASEQEINDLAAPDVLTTPRGSPPQTGQPVTMQGFRGSGRADQGSVYNEGATGALLGEDATYFAINEQIARRFGPEVEQQSVRLSNPLVIDSDSALARWMTGDPSRPVPMENAARSRLIEDFRRRVEQAGHDGVIVNVPQSADMNTAGEPIKRLREVFGDTQVVVFPDQGRGSQQREQVTPQRSGVQASQRTSGQQLGLTGVGPEGAMAGGITGEQGAMFDTREPGESGADRADRAFREQQTPRDAETSEMFPDVDPADLRRLDTLGARELVRIAKRIGVPKQRLSPRKAELTQAISEHINTRRNLAAEPQEQSNPIDRHQAGFARAGAMFDIANVPVGVAQVGKRFNDFWATPLIRLVEVQGGEAGRSLAGLARRAADEARRIQGRLNPRLVAMLRLTAGTTPRSRRAVNDEQITQLVAGQAPRDLYDAVVSRMAEVTQGSTSFPGERSRAAQSRAWRAAVSFDSYIQMKTDRTLRVNQALADAVHSKDAKRIAAASKVAADYYLGSAASGAAAWLLRALAVGGTAGLGIALHEAEDDPLEFAWESLKYTLLGGPTEAIFRTVADDNANVYDPAARVILPLSILQDVWDMLHEQGRYKDRDWLERGQEFMTRHVTISGPVATWAAVMGFSQKDVQLDASVNAYWRWRYEHVPPGRFTPGHMQEQHRTFRRHMRRAYAVLRRNGGDPTPHVLLALGVEGKGTRNIKASIRARRLLRDLDEQQLEEFRSAHPEWVYQKLLAHDTMLDAWADRIEKMDSK